MNYPPPLAILVLLVIYVTMVYGPIAAFLVELFPTRIRYTSMSLPYRIGNGWFGGMLPLLATAMVAASGNIYFGLWYPIGVGATTILIGVVFLRDSKTRPCNKFATPRPAGTDRGVTSLRGARFKQHARYDQPRADTGDGGKIECCGRDVEQPVRLIEAGEPDAKPDNRAENE